MHVTFYSACRKEAVYKTRRVLDAYAMRTPASSWATGITEEGLE